MTLLLEFINKLKVIIIEDNQSIIFSEVISEE